MCAAAIITFAQAPVSKDIKKQEKKERINNLIKREEEGALIYSKQTAFGFKANTDGWGASYEHGKYKTITTTNLWWAELGSRKSPNLSSC